MKNLLSLRNDKKTAGPFPLGMGPAVVKPGRASAPLVIRADAYRRLGAALGVSGTGTTYKVLVLVLRLNQLVAVLLRNLAGLSNLLI